MAGAGLIVRLDNEDRRFEIVDGRPVLVGRTLECDIRLASPSVSRRHAMFMGRSGECGLKDMGSANGTFLNGKRISRSMRLRDGDVVRIGDFTLKFLEKLPESPEAAVAEPSPVAGEAGAVPSPRPVLSPDPEPAVEADDGDGELSSPASLEPAAAAIAAIAAAPEPEPEPDPTESLPPPPSPKPESESEQAETPSPAQPMKAVAPPPPPPPPSLPPPPPPPPGSPAKTVAPPPALPEKPKLPAFFDGADGEDKSETGGDDSVFSIEEEPEPTSEEAMQLAVAKAAAEAGLVGEFVPDTGDEPSGGGDERQAPVQAAPAADGPELNSAPIDAEMRQAIETRLVLYSFLEDMRAERAAILAKNPGLPDPVKSELARQDRELDKIPSPAQAAGMIDKRAAKQKELMARIAEARQKGEQPPAKPSRAMRNAEEMAITQWRFIVKSTGEALPSALAACFRLAEDEPITPVLREIGQDPIALMGGAVYYLALETLLEEAKGQRLENKAKLARVPNPEEERKGGRKDRKKEDDEDLPTESYAELTAMDAQLANRAAWLGLELAMMEKNLIQEFWRLYPELALAYLPRGESMPMAVRAYLRHGAVGFKPWWMKDEVRAHLTRDCAEDIAPRLRMSRGVTNVVYAEEYLAAVANLECTPAMDENLEINERNSPNWKADKALRKLINARSQGALMEELVGSLQDRIDKLNAEGAVLDDRISKLIPGSKNFKQAKNELGQQRQALKVESTKLSNLSDKIRNETLASFKEAEKDTEERFASGELPRPTTEFLIRRECEAVHKIGRLVANLKERFMPLVIRDNFAVGTDAVNDRPAILSEVAEIERRDPSIFLETLVASKKKGNRVDLRISPAIVLLPAAGALAYAWSPRAKPEDGRLAIPTMFLRRRVRERQLVYLMSDFRWDTSKAAAGMDIMTSDTIVAGFMTVRWDWRKRSKEGREKGLIFNEQNDRTNWRRVYEAYLQSADDAGKKLFNRNYDFYERIVMKYFDPPEGVAFLKK